MVAFWLAAACLVGCGPVSPPAPQRPLAPEPNYWKNSLGMKFLPIPGTNDVLLAVWETRVRDFAAFVDATGYNASERFFYHDGKSWQRGDKDWRDPGFAQTEDHPVVGVSWRDAVAFCRWLTEHERTTGTIGPRQAYRLPTDAEWSLAAGTQLVDKIPHGAANYHINLETDFFEYTSPVGNFPANEHGFYDMAGNVWEYCLDRVNDRDIFRVIRGGSWQNWHLQFIGMKARGQCGPDVRITLYGFRVALAPDDARNQTMIRDYDRHEKEPERPFTW